MTHIDAGTLASLPRAVRNVAAGAALCVVVAIGIWGYERVWKYVTPDPTVPPACYGADRAYVPENEALPLRGAPGPRGNPSVDQRHDLAYHERLKEAEAACTPASCGREAWNEYKSALFWYLSARLQHTRNLDRVYGRPGLRRAQEIYSTAEDVHFEQGLRERYRARVFRLNNLRQNADAIAILVLRDAAALRPCHKSDVAG